MAIDRIRLCVKWHVVAANLVERADDTALENAPETLNRLSVDGTDDVLALRMVNGCVREGFVEVLVTNPLDRYRAS
jgi:hypothetical protein